MSRVVEQFSQRTLRIAIANLLRTITNANGYQTQPRVTTDPRVMFDRGSEDHILFVASASTVPVADGVPLRFKVQHAIAIIGETAPGDGDPADCTDALLQDVMNALTQQAAIDSLRSTMGKSFDFDISSVEFDEPFLICDDGLTRWTLTLTTSFQQTPPW
jgi:hypothetical protein